MSGRLFAAFLLVVSSVVSFLDGRMKSGTQILMESGLGGVIILAMTSSGVQMYSHFYISLLVFHLFKKTLTFLHCHKVCLSDSTGGTVNFSCENIQADDGIQSQIFFFY